ncbi:PREDICTED: uncharacterized protein LOC104821728 isoform X2 [Tarenaya hassleriana]|uniref:uncharacterized protein LOC104821728 isoform X2 n=1 Tax=Tarenaya hassleriana TaxID=28532 RepID=UPI00053C710A|nr:PREDICTED: uncharacterized protein LOC104821728 isoform X2 [Tarenaya hassleriana]
MRRYLMERVLMDNGFLILSLILSLHPLISFSFEKPNGVCISKGGRFPPYESEGKVPKAVGRGSKGLNLCRVYRRRTCCSAAQAHPAFLAIRNLASYGEASQDCLHLYELLECSICDPTVGIQPGPPRICASFCDRVFQACSEAYFGGNTINRVISPCGVNDDIICSKASKWETNGTAFCEAAGFAVQTVDDDGDSKEETCYGSKTSLDSVVESWRKGSRAESSQKTEPFSPFGRLLRWFEDMSPVGKITCVVILLVLSGRVSFFMRRRRRHNQWQRLAADRRGGRRLGGNSDRNLR